MGTNKPTEATRELITKAMQTHADSLIAGDVKAVDTNGINLEDLSGTFLHGLYLCRANLTGADLCGVNVGRANLRGANLYGTNLQGANLIGADLRGADLGGANLRGADLDEANLTGANLYKADLTGANLSKADLAGVLFALDSLLCTATFFKGAIHLDSAEFYTEEGKRIIGLTIGRDGRLCAEEKPRAKQKTRKTRAQFGASAQGDAPAEGNVVHAADLDFVPKLPAAPAAAPKAAPG